MDNPRSQARGMILGLPPKSYTVPLLKSLLGVFHVQTKANALRRDLLRRLQLLEQSLEPKVQDSVTDLLVQGQSITYTNIAERLAIEVRPRTKNHSKKVEIDREVHRDCEVCYESVPTSSFEGKPISPACGHNSSICHSCLGEHINLGLANIQWEALSCPFEGCDQLLSHDIVRQYAAAEYTERCVSNTRIWAQFMTGV